MKFREEFDKNVRNFTENFEKFLTNSGSDLKN